MPWIHADKLFSSQLGALEKNFTISWFVRLATSLLQARGFHMGEWLLYMYMYSHNLPIEVVDLV